MACFSNVLLAVDFDRTLTDRSSRIPQNNIDAIREFTAQGGAFTVATGRSVPMFQHQFAGIPANAPFILYNGAACFDAETGALTQTVEIPDGETVFRQIISAYPFLWAEIQGVDYHYLIGECPMRDEFYRYNNAPAKHIAVETLPQPLLKFALYGDFVAPTVASLFEDLPEQIPMIDRVTQELRAAYGDRLVIDRAAPRIIDIQNKAVNKGTAARQLAKRLGRSVLVCAGDANNDVSMLCEADLAYVPADCDKRVAAMGFRTVCPCTDGAIADLLARLETDLHALRSELQS